MSTSKNKQDNRCFKGFVARKITEEFYLMPACDINIKELTRGISSRGPNGGSQRRSQRSSDFVIVVETINKRYLTDDDSADPSSPPLPPLPPLPAPESSPKANCSSRSKCIAPKSTYQDDYQAPKFKKWHVPEDSQKSGDFWNKPESKEVLANCEQRDDDDESDDDN